MGTEKHCYRCGHESAAEARFCARCGLALTGEPASPAPPTPPAPPAPPTTPPAPPAPPLSATTPPPPPFAPTAPPPPGPAAPSPLPAGADWSPEQLPVVTWDLAFPLLTNRFFMWDMTKVWLITYGIVGALLSVMCLLADNAKIVPMLLGVMGIIIGSLLVLSFIIVLIMFARGWPTRFTVAPNGVRADTISRAALNTNRAVTLIGLLAGSSLTAGAGLLATAQESINIPWTRVRRITEYPGPRVITLSNSWRTVVRLYCTPEDYPRVAALCRYYHALAQQRPSA